MKRKPVQARRSRRGEGMGRDSMARGMATLEASSHSASTTAHAMPAPAARSGTRRKPTYRWSRAATQRSLYMRMERAMDGTDCQGGLEGVGTVQFHTRIGGVRFGPGAAVSSDLRDILSRRPSLHAA